MVEKREYKKSEKNDKYDDDKYDDDMEEGGRKGRRFSGGRAKKPCRFMAGEEEISNLTYKNPRFLASFMTEHGKIVPRRVTGNCAQIQKKLTAEIKRARHLALIGYTAIGPNAG